MTVHALAHGPDHLTAARLATRLERAGVTLVVQDAALSATAPDPATLARVLTPELRSAITALKPALLALFGPCAVPAPPLVDGLSRVFAALVHLDPAWSAIPARSRRTASPDTRCVHCSRPAEHRFMGYAVHPACFFARCSAHMLELPEGVSCCECDLCRGIAPSTDAPALLGPTAPPAPLVPPAPLDPLDAIFGGEPAQDMVCKNQDSLGEGLS